tara:strand:+ start:1249 stop:1452 length:204 start_codon:yes stop_codon:yes gene_type:complete
MELIYSHLGYDDLSQSIEELRSFIDTIQAASLLTFDDYLDDLGIPENQRDEGDDPDYDGFPICWNIF